MNFSTSWLQLLTLELNNIGSYFNCIPYICAPILLWTSISPRHFIILNIAHIPIYTLYNYLKECLRINDILFDYILKKKLQT